MAGGSHRRCSASPLPSEQLEDRVKSGNTHWAEPSLPSGASVVARGPQCSDREWKVHEDNDCGPRTEGLRKGGLWTSSPGTQAGACRTCAAHGQPRPPGRTVGSGAHVFLPRSCSRPPGPAALPATSRVSLEEPPSALVSLPRVATPVPPPPRTVSRVREIIKVNVCENS